LTANSTVGWALSRARRELARANIESPQLTAELLLTHVLGWNRVRLLTHPEMPLPDGARDRLAGLIKRRCAGEPLEYILGAQEFFGLSFRVTPAVLIPRPETEILVERVLALASGSKRLRIADVGTGSGCIAISVARELPTSQVFAVDISPAALSLALENANSLGVSARVHFICGDMLECFRPRTEFDLILSNPPYVAGCEVPDLPPAVRDHEPMVALFGGQSGLDACGRLAVQARRHLAAGGRILMEIGAGQAQSVTRILQEAGFAVETIVEDLRGIPRCVVAH
jgi:release factor glutamine methyltransferase